MSPDGPGRTPALPGPVIGDVTAGDPPADYRAAVEARIAAARRAKEAETGEPPRPPVYPMADHPMTEPTNPPPPAAYRLPASAAPAPAREAPAPDDPARPAPPARAPSRCDEAARVPGKPCPACGRKVAKDGNCYGRIPSLRPGASRRVRYDDLGEKCPGCGGKMNRFSGACPRCKDDTPSSADVVPVRVRPAPAPSATPGPADPPGARGDGPGVGLLRQFSAGLASLGDEDARWLLETVYARSRADRSAGKGDPWSWTTS